MDLSIVIPMYNEKDCAEGVVREMHRALHWRAWSSEIIVVDNGSSDGTREILDRVVADVNSGHSRPEVRILHFENNRGYGGAIRAGLEVARGKSLGFTCGDGEVSSRDLVRIYRRLKDKDLDVCKGWRVGRKDGLFRVVISAGYHTLISKLFLLAVQDINGYPVFFKRSAWEKLKLEEGQWLINVEILDQASQNRLKLEEVIIRHQDRAGGESHVRWYFPLIFLWEIMRYKWRRRRVRK